MANVMAKTAALFLATAGPAMAQDSVPAQDRWAQVAACGNERSIEARHACVDSVMRAAGVLDPELETAINRENFGRSERSAPQSSAASVAAAAVDYSQPSEVGVPPQSSPPLNGIMTRVAFARLSGSRRLVVTTTEGAVWRQTDTGSIRRLPREGESFEVREGALGSYRCTFNDMTTFRCERRK